VLGAGAWGTAIACALAGRLEVSLWPRDAAQATTMRRARCNARYLPEVAFPPTLEIAAEAGAALRGSALALIATPVSGLREALALLRGTDAAPVWLCKGLEQGTALMPHQLVDATLGARVRCGALSGPSFALEVAQGLPCALTLASRDEAFARGAAELLHGGRLRVYYSDDLIGVEVGGAVKNVMAIAVGISDGLGLGQNARAALITRGLAEIARLGVALGGAPETFMGLAGAGDLILTATGDLSRNRQVGLALAGGKTLVQILDELGHVAEGVRTANEVVRIAKARGVEMPISEAVAAVLEGRLGAAKAVELLLSRDPRAE
jgi:glycerol-3-phosphate dehydrogenase (NAD(P)+)